jgi:tRNA(adenine34) deaminase
MINQDNFFMQQALLQAYKALEKDEVPIGAIIVNNLGSIIGKGYNLTEDKYSQSNHAEIRAIQNAGKKIKDWRLEYCTIYVTLEPCLMCISLIGLSRIERVVYGADSPLFGYHLDKEILPDLYKRHIKGITKGVMANEVELLLKKFFKDKSGNRE